MWIWEWGGINLVIGGGGRFLIIWEKLGLVGF